MTATTADAPPPDLRLPKRRGVELLLLIGAVLISVYGYAAVGLAKNDAVPPDVVEATARASGCSPSSPISRSASAPRTPIRCCCPSPYCSTDWAWY